ncbi:bifunctional heptose 7-phosphate kinase/heptose 1-phosphate adenyltransferase [Desulfonatronum sp. SC1]|uniref:bifunctional heptose 7-phosphate kinase/heptose 1-phosphate adenyltransferase n=1 Tax=Desulfonatronum sp. SC1 TaxID=2109626 RepID=UPI000D301FA1|nr:PfkB family carbohydrate kinase [Desulfonatronum sp. SC1]PTN36522.1 D-glycero-beta-D-manno-heptose-7-phosphate kinase [Desulfonatronum sp. SC1]
MNSSFENTSYKPEDLLASIDKLAGNTVVIIGDVMLDEYIFGAVERISPEAPVPVVRIENEEYRLGGAGNVAKNITALGGRASLFGFLGGDGSGERMREMFREHGIEDGCIQECERPTTRKTRVIAQQQQIVRIDRESACVPSADGMNNLLHGVGEALEKCRVLIVSDYGKGLVSGPVMDRLRRIRESMPHELLIIVDPKPENYPAYRGVDLLTPNTKEAGVESTVRLDGGGGDSLSKDVFAAGQRLMGELESRELLITLGAKGMLLFRSPHQAVHIPTAARKVYDVTGAGDTVIAVLGLSLAAGLESLTGCLLANYAAGVVVGQIGATAVLPEHLREAVVSWPEINIRQYLIP